MAIDQPSKELLNITSTTTTEHVSGWYAPHPAATRVVITASTSAAVALTLDIDEEGVDGTVREVVTATAVAASSTVSHVFDRPTGRVRARLTAGAATSTNIFVEGRYAGHAGAMS